VVLHHISWIPTVFKETSIFNELHRSGHCGVTLFFILSGVVLSMGYNDRVRTARQVLSFYWARIARIVPLWLVISLPVIAAGSAPLEYLLMVQAWSGDASVTFSGVAVAWTLSVEFFF
jgi:peptidoglycan/LPS O-acetylase OafA/YrhL